VNVPGQRDLTVRQNERGMANTPRRGGRADLRSRPFPLPTSDDWTRPDEVLRRLYQHAEAHAIETADWYLAHRRGKRAYSRLLRALSILLVTAGGLEPLAAAASSGRGIGWGYVLLGGAGACVGFDHFFGTSSGWMRYMTTAQRIDLRLRRFQLDWATRNAADVLDGTAALDVAGYLLLLREFVDDIAAITAAETGEWVAEFQTGLVQLETQAHSK
jgi:hypothetical protein